jgi:hypothetical protein
VKEKFNEGMLSNNRDPVDAADQDFDWQRLYAQLGEDARSGDYDRELAETVIRLLEVLVKKRDRPMYPMSVGLRVIALAWVLNPAYFKGCPSARDLAKRCRVKPSTFARFTGEASRMIRWRNRGQRHAWNWHNLERSGLR